MWRVRLILKRSTVLVADDHVVVLARVLSLLDPIFQVVGTACDGADLVAKAQRLCPDVIVLDITMPRVNGIEAAHRLRELGSVAKLVFLTVNDQPEFVQACIREGGMGYVTKVRMAMDLIPAINEALLNRRFLSPTVNLI